MTDNGGGLTILKLSTTNQEGESRKIEIACGEDPATYPVLAYRRWIAAARITEGPVFGRFSNKTTMGAKGITERMVALVVKKAAARANAAPPRFPMARGGTAASNGQGRNEAGGG